MTNSIVRRNRQHKARKTASFTAAHRCTRLVWYETHATPASAIAREKEIKGWTRARKIALIEDTNPHWLDLSEAWNRVPQYGDSTTAAAPPSRTNVFCPRRKR